MEVIRGLHNLREKRWGTVATIGNFDGVHLGHRAVLDQCRDQAAQLGLPVSVVVFEPQPREYFAGDQAPPRLTRLRDKVSLLGECGIDRVLVLPFNEHLRCLTAMEFIDQVLVEGLGVRHLVVGDDFRFGCDRSGDFHLLSVAGEHHGFAVEHTRTFCIDDERVSSTRVRTTLACGNFTAAARLMGRPYAYRGRVVRDQQRGRTIGVPTANLLLSRGALVLRGVYAVMVQIEGEAEFYPAVANVGWRPTVGSSRPVLEAHLLDYDGDLYDRHLTVVPCIKLRNEMSFDSFESLKTQIQDDIRQAREYFEQHVQGGFLRDEAQGLFPLASAPCAREAVTHDSSAGHPADHDDG
ncbi:bifunctional riboflavin kinase/FAD synthetase [Halomonas binhaiensis]|uniref:Riboflavin biosynthesis protein n=1 Tax=Halomonas binhaiensis TaxID=2562282 RepID=A0A5C1NA22_9GAMM|nr:bifunctional riboflavin kinase/FAD synthetase [Halomonas binhaiensis]QEM80552.1 bifunctional riboflavin kinase/FAD synthetase [Halomonas binhaiensis]